MTVYDDCYESGERARNAQYRWQREKEEEEEKRGRSAPTVEREETTVENSGYLSVTCLLDTLGRETIFV